MPFRNHLSKQLGFLGRSCEAYDAGYIDEAVRIATVIRVLVHDTNRSNSLLKHLGATTINLLSTTEDRHLKPFYTWGLVCKERRSHLMVHRLLMLPFSMGRYSASSQSVNGGIR